MSCQRALIFITVATVLAIGIGCGGGSGPSAPSVVPFANSGEAPSVKAGHVLWGMWQCHMEPGSGAINVVPLRTAAFTANVNNLLEGQPGNLQISDMDLTDFESEGLLPCTVTLTHPLAGMDQFHGFDVWGVFLHNGSAQLGYDGLIYSSDPDSGKNEAILQNPDGFTRWFNYPEFDGDGMPILEYWPGKLSNLPDPTATLNPYKIFADGLDLDDDYYDWITAPGNADDRGIYRAGQTHSRRYELDFPIIGGHPVVDFQYAVVATWEPGDPTLTGQPNVYDPFDFPTAANCEEPFFLEVSTVGSELYNDGTGDSGGNFLADIEVFDWQGGSVGGLGVPNEVESIIVEGDFVPGGSYEFTQAQLAVVAIAGTDNSSVFQVEIVDCTPQASGEASFWVIVEAAGQSGATYDQGFGTEYPAGANRAAFLPGTVTVSSESPLDVIYVDDSNTTGIEDGTQTHPYNTIQEGVDAAALLVEYEVWVDDSGNPYDEQVNMATSTILRSVNWDESDGSNRAFIDGPENPDTHSVHFFNVDDALLDGFQIGFAGPCDGYDRTQMIRIDGGSNNTVQDCLFTGQTNRYYVYPVVAYGTANLTIANCRMADIDKDTSSSGCIYFYGVYAINCPGLTVRNNVITNIRPTSDGSHKMIYNFWLENSSSIVVKNNLIHHIIPHAPGNAMFIEGYRIKGCTNPEVINNTIDHLNTSDAFFINQCFGYYFDGSNGATFTNNIVTSIYSSGFPPPLARGVMAFGCTVVCDYTDVWDVAGAYYGNASAGTGAISANPEYNDPDNEDYDISATSPAQAGDPSFDDWDDSPGDGSRMGCHGGPGGEIVGLLTPE